MIPIVRHITTVPPYPGADGKAISGGMCLITLVLLPILEAFSIRVNDERHGDMAGFDVDRAFPAYWTRNDGEVFSPPGNPETYPYGEGARSLVHPTLLCVV